MSTAAIAVLSVCGLVAWCATLLAICAVVSMVYEGRR